MSNLLPTENGSIVKEVKNPALVKSKKSKAGKSDDVAAGTADESSLPAASAVELEASLEAKSDNQEPIAAIGEGSVQLQDSVQSGKSAGFGFEQDSFRFDEVADPNEDHGAGQNKTNTRKPKKLSEENKLIVETAKNVETRLKDREQICLTMMTIDVAKLPSAHRFTKNSPWLKGSYGTSYSWVADYEESEDGSRATWKNVRWSFNLERNVRDRNDLVITVCSKNLIIGRYVLGKNEFTDIPNTKSGYFEVSGDVMSGLGPAGKIRVLFLRSIAERPKGPMKPVDPAMASPVKNAGVLNPMKQLTLLHKKLYVKIISTAVMDLKSAHFLDTNCPFIALEAGEWVGVSDVAHNAGVAARWNSLNWKFAITGEDGIRLMIHSKNVMIGQMHVSMDDITAIEPRPNGIIEVIKHITNGKEITGKVKVNLLAEHPNEVPGGSAPAGSELAKQLVQNISLDGTLKTLDADGNVVLNGATKGSSVPPTSPSAAETGALEASQATLNEQGDLVLMKPFIKVPFQIFISEVTVLDTIKAHLLRKNSLSVNVVCGQFGRATDELKGSGRYAHWINLNWRIQVKGQNNFRITAWSHGVSIGASSLTVAELLDMPTDYEQNTEIFAKLYNEKKEIVGKVKLTCRYEPIKDTVGGVTGAKPIPGLDYKNNKDPESSFLPNIGAESANRSGGSYMEDVEDEGTYNNVLATKEELVLPVVATIHGISVYDMAPAHTFKKNSPQVKFTCDRKSAITAPLKSAGSVATWTELKWVMKIRADSYLVAQLTSAEVVIGRVQMQPEDLLKIPINDAGFIEIKTLLRRDKITTAKLHMTVKLENLNENSLNMANATGATPSSGAFFPQSRGLPGYSNSLNQISAASVAGGAGGLMDAQSSYLSPVPQQRVPTIPRTGASAAGAGTGAGSALLPQDVGSYPYLAPYYNEEDDDVGGGGGGLSFLGADPFAPGAAAAAMGMSSADMMTTTTMGGGGGGYGGPAPVQQQVIFDTNLMNASNAQRLGLSFKIHIQEVDIMEMRSMHRFGAKNCPFLSAACGKWAATSPIQANVTETAFWTNLNWKFVCKSGGSVRVIVTSKSVIMGAVSFSSDDLLNAVSDDKGHRRVTADLRDTKTSELNGRFKLAYTMDVLQNRSQSVNSPLGLAAPSPSAGGGGDNDAMSRTYPGSRNSSAWDAAGRGGGQSTAGSMYGTGLSVAAGGTGGGMGYLSPQQQYQHQLQQRQRQQQQQQYTPTSGMPVNPFNPQASAAASGFSPFNPTFNNRAASPSGGAGARRGSSPSAVGRGGRGGGGGGGGGGGSPWEYGQARGNSATDYYDRDRIMEDTLNPDPRTAIEFPFNVNIVEMSALDLMQAHRLKRNQPVIKCYCDTFYQATAVQPVDNTDVTNFRRLHWLFPVNEKSIFKLSVESREKEIGSVLVDLNNLRSIPFDRLGNREIVLSVTDSKGRAGGKVRLVTQLSNTATNRYEHHMLGFPDDDAEAEGGGRGGGGGGGGVGDSGFQLGGAMDANSWAEPFSSPSRTFPPPPSSSGAAGAGMHGAAVSGKSVMSELDGGAPAAAGTSYGKDFEYLLASQQAKIGGGGVGSGSGSGDLVGTGSAKLAAAAGTAAAGGADGGNSEPTFMTVTVSGIAVIDLISVHAFSQNSPSVNLACGKVVATTKALEGAGRMGNWENLEISMKMEKSSLLRVLISSKDKVIGQCAVNRTKLLGGRRNQRGYYVLFAELEQHNKKPAGKIKFVYTIEEASITG